ncbi:MAG: hypothetical protein AB8B55_18130, partial [Mariniblastus sp.]
MSLCWRFATASARKFKSTSDDEADVVSVIQEGASACSSLQLIGSVATIVMMVICVGYFRAALKRI